MSSSMCVHLMSTVSKPSVCIRCGWCPNDLKFDKIEKLAKDKPLCNEIEIIKAAEKFADNVWSNPLKRYYDEMIG